MLLFLLVLVTLLLAYLARLLHTAVLYAKSIDEDVKLIVKRQISAGNDLSRIVRAMRLNFSQERKEFSETRVEELLRCGESINAIKYRYEMSADLLDEAHDYVQRVAKRIGVSF